jgi:predicted TPR repeat methyltransferase
MAANTSIESSTPSRAPDQLTLQEALELGVRYHQAGQLDTAEAVYRRVLEVWPEQPQVLHFLGVLTHQRGKSPEALILIRRAIELQPRCASFHNNLGNVLFEMESFAEAARAYEQSAALAPDDPDVHNNLGVVRRTLRDAGAAAAAYQRAIELDPRHADAYHNMGNLLTAQGRIKDAVTFLCTSITLRPVHAESRRLLGLAYANLGRMNEAAQVYRDWLQEEPQDPVAQHMLAACGGGEVPARASNSFVEMVFDSFARSFDTKLEKLEYQAPQLIAAALARICATPTGTLIALDAGCGTGLCGPLVAPFVAHLSGVDLSSEMLAKAAARDAYHSLTQGELTEYLRAHASAFDLILSADTLCYFGDLEEALGAARLGLRAGGVLIFTVEQVDSTPGNNIDYRLNPHGRYSHSRDYVSRILQSTGFDVLEMNIATLRMESGCAVRGLVVGARAGR